MDHSGEAEGKGAVFWGRKEVKRKKIKENGIKGVVSTSQPWQNMGIDSRQV